MKQDYKKTTYACFIGYIVQAIVNSFVPLLFVTFQKTYQIPLTKITLLITINFVIQLLIDLLSAGFIDKIGYRASVMQESQWMRLVTSMHMEHPRTITISLRRAQSNLHLVRMPVK